MTARVLGIIILSISLLLGGYLIGVGSVDTKESYSIKTARLPEGWKEVRMDSLMFKQFVRFMTYENLYGKQPSGWEMFQDSYGNPVPIPVWGGYRTP